MEDGWGHWLAGFAAGEGSFNISKNGRGARFCSFRLALHVEDAPVLREIAAWLGIGSMWVGHPPSQRSPRALWTVQSKADCLVLVTLFERYPLRAKKQCDFEVWARAVRLWQDMVYASQHSAVKNDWAPLDRLRDELMAGRPQRGRKAWVV
jgi:hypothetical protein